MLAHTLTKRTISRGTRSNRSGVKTIRAWPRSREDTIPLGCSTFTTVSARSNGATTDSHASDSRKKMFLARSIPPTTETVPLAGGFHRARHHDVANPGAEEV